jgi:hypothetical protein
MITLKFSYDIAADLIKECKQKSIEDIEPTYKKSILKRGHDKVNFDLDTYMLMIHYNKLTKDKQCKLKLDECGCAYFFYIFADFQITAYPSLAPLLVDFVNKHDKNFNQ